MVDQNLPHRLGSYDNQPPWVLSIVYKQWVQHMVCLIYMYIINIHSVSMLVEKHNTILVALQIKHRLVVIQQASEDTAPSTVFAWGRRYSLHRNISNISQCIIHYRYLCLQRDCTALFLSDRSLKCVSFFSTCTYGAWLNKTRYEPFVSFQSNFCQLQSYCRQFQS